MQDTIIVEVTRRTPHPLYKKLLKRSKQYKVAPNGHAVQVGEHVVMEEMRPVSKEKYFKIIEVIKDKHAVKKEAAK